MGNEPTKESLKLHARGTADLTNRQGQVLGYLAMGLTANEIGERLRISTRTARAHMDVLKRKLGANRSRDLPIAYRRATGLDPLELVGATELAPHKNKARPKHPLADTRSDQNRPPGNPT